MTGLPPAVDASLPVSPGGILAGILSAARGESTPGAAAALASLTATRRLAAELERGELALIEAARDGGATWSQISAALGTRNRQTAQKRHADLARRRPCPPAVDTPEAHPGPRPGNGQPAAIPPAGEGDPAAGARRLQFTLAPAADPGPGPATPFPPSSILPASPGQRRPSVPKITDDVIAEGRYELAKASDHAETRAWRVLVGGRTAGLVRPTWHGERSRPGWEPVDPSGLALPVRGTGRVTAAGNARTRDAAAVSLLRALQQEQKNAPGGTRRAPARRREGK